MSVFHIVTGDSRVVLKQMRPASINCVVTSPPYWGLRDYGVDGQIGLEADFNTYIRELVDIFREVRRVLRDDGTLWLNLGDSYNNAQSGGHGKTGGLSKSTLASPAPFGETPTKKAVISFLKNKDLCGIPWHVAFALQADGWYLRQDIIWAKPNPMPESVRDRCTKAHEYLFLLTKNERYYFDQDAILEPVAEATRQRLAQPTLEQQVGSFRVPGKTNGAMKAVGRKAGNKSHKYVTEYEASDTEEHRTKAGLLRSADKVWEMRNRRSVWTVTTQPFKEAHFATFPPALVEPCIKAGCPPNGVVLDPFAGAGTTSLVAMRLDRNSVGIELNPTYADLARSRIAADSASWNFVPSVALSSHRGPSPWAPSSA